MAKVGDILQAALTLTDAAGGVMTASGPLTLTAVPDVVPVPPDPGPGPNPPGSAQYFAPASLVASSLETGTLGRVTAWGGSPFGQGYAYSLEGAPAGVVIDKDTGRLYLTAALAAGDKVFNLVATNRDDATKIAKFQFTLNVRQGVTSGRTGTQILHKTYTPEAFGGNLTAMQKQILADQAAAGDLNLRAVIQFASGKTYTYTDNHWLTGIQYYRTEVTGTGAKPILKNTSNDAGGFTYDQGPLNIGKGANCMIEPPNKAIMGLIASAKMGDKTVTLLTASDASRLKPGHYHAIFSYCQQLGGYPPNVRWFDYAIVTSVQGATVTLDRPLKNAHKADYWEDPNDGGSLGKARIGPWDLADGKTACTQRGLISGLELQWVANYDITYLESHIYLEFENCKIPNVQISMSQYAELRGTTVVSASEPDKMSEALVFDKCTLQGVVGGATGFAYMLLRDTTLGCTQISPRQLRSLGSTWDAKGDTYYNVPYGCAYNGPCLESEFTGTTFVASSPNQATWAWQSNPVSPLPLSASSWAANKLVIPRSFGGFQDWMVWLYEGIMLFTGSNVAQPGAYGRVDKVYAPADGSAIWCDVTWLSGTKPTSGNLNIPQKGLRKLVWGAGTRITQGGWLDPSYVCMTGTPSNARAFPQGIS